MCLKNLIHEFWPYLLHVLQKIAAQLLLLKYEFIEGGGVGYFENNLYLNY